MMAGLYALFSLAMVAIFCNQRKAAIGVVTVGLLLGLAMLWHHATSVLEINW